MADEAATGASVEIEAEVEANDAARTVAKNESSLGRFTANEKRSLAVMTFIALAFGAYFLRGYLELLGLAAVLAYLSLPLYKRFQRRFSGGVAATLTVLSALLIVVVPLAGILTMAGIQIKQMVDSVSAWVQQTDLTDLGERVLAIINEALSRIPYVHLEVTVEWIQENASRIAASFGDFALEFAQSSVGGIAGAVTAGLIFLYVFVALLGGEGRIVELIKDLNPLNPQVSDIYLAKIGAMVKATVGGQFVIAAVQGLLGAISIYIGGIHQGFFMFVIFLSVLSIIPLGSGVITIPLGIALVFTGNIPGGLFIALFHILVTSNVDNVLRPMLVPKTAYLPPSLMLLAVFAGLPMFGFPGIVFGPVIMIVIVTTINLYRSVMKGAHWVEDFDDDAGVVTERKNLWARLRERSRKRRAAKQPSPQPSQDSASA